METELIYLLIILEKSVEKNGEIPLTNKHLLNILKLAEKMRSSDETRSELASFDPNWD